MLSAADAEKPASSKYARPAIATKIWNHRLLKAMKTGRWLKTIHTDRSSLVDRS